MLNNNSTCAKKSIMKVLSILTTNIKMIWNTVLFLTIFLIPWLQLDRDGRGFGLFFLIFYFTSFFFLLKVNREVRRIFFGFCKIYINNDILITWVSSSGLTFE